ncbi:MAG: phosphoenolpyruvate carboxylase, partial [Pseudomonadota bacterium]
MTLDPFNAPAEPEDAAPPRDDIRLLGRLLGDTVRAQEGEAVFEIIEAVRRSAVGFHYGGGDADRRALEEKLDGLTPTDAVHVARAFSFFSHFSNIAE